MAAPEAPAQSQHRPTHARIHAAILRDLAHNLTEDSWTRLASLMELRTRRDLGLSVGGAPGAMDYADLKTEMLPDGVLDKARAWLRLQLATPDVA